MPQSRPLDINILPEQYRPRRITAPMVLAIVAVAVLLLGLVPTYSVLIAMQARTDNAQTRLDQAQASLAQAQVDPEQLEVDQQIEQMREQIAALQAEFGGLDQRHVHRSAAISGIVTALVPHVHIITIAQNGNDFSLTGNASDYTLVLSYARALQSSGRFATVRVVSIANPDSSAEIEFSITMEQ